MWRVALRVRARRGKRVATAAAARKLTIENWYPLTKGESHASARPSLHTKELADLGNRAWMVDNGIGVPAAGQEVAAGSEVFAALDGRLLGSIAAADTMRPEEKYAIEALHGMGIRTVPLTVDARHVAFTVGGALDIKEIEAELLPEDKFTRIRALVA